MFSGGWLLFFVICYDEMQNSVSVEWLFCIRLVYTVTMFWIEFGSAGPKHIVE